MKRNWSKKALSLLMAGTMMAGLAGCGSDAAQNDSSAAASAAQSSAAQSTDASTSDNSLRPDTLDTITVVLFGEESPRMQQLMEEKYQHEYPMKESLMNNLSEMRRLGMDVFLRNENAK